MRRIKEVLRLKYELGLGQRQIARSCSIGQATANDYCGGQKPPCVAIRCVEIAGSSRTHSFGRRTRPRIWIADE